MQATIRIGEEVPRGDEPGRIRWQAVLDLTVELPVDRAEKLAKLIMRFLSGEDDGT